MQHCRAKPTLPFDVLLQGKHDTCDMTALRSPGFLPLRQPFLLIMLLPSLSPHGKVHVRDELICISHHPTLYTHTQMGSEGKEAFPGIRVLCSFKGRLFCAMSAEHNVGYEKAQFHVIAIAPSLNVFNAIFIVLKHPLDTALARLPFR